MEENPKHPLTAWLDAQEESRAAIARRLKISRMTLSRYELGRKPERQILIESQWHQIRRISDIDPAGATYSLQCFTIDDPTT